MVYLSRTFKATSTLHGEDQRAPYPRTKNESLRDKPLLSIQIQQLCHDRPQDSRTNSDYLSPLSERPNNRHSLNNFGTGVPWYFIYDKSTTFLLAVRLWLRYSKRVHLNLDRPALIKRVRSGLFHEDLADLNAGLCPKWSSVQK